MGSKAGATWRDTSRESAVTYVDMTFPRQAARGCSFISFSSFECKGPGRGGADNCDGVIMLISVGWLPPYLHPSGACPQTIVEGPVRSLNLYEGYAFDRGRASL